MFDLLLTSPESLSAEQVAQQLSTSVDGMERLLDALVAFEILEVETANGTGPSIYRSSSSLKSECGILVEHITGFLCWTSCCVCSLQLCTAAPTWPICTWPKKVPSLFTT